MSDEPASPEPAPSGDTASGGEAASLTRRDFVRRAAIAGAVLVPAIGAAAIVGLRRPSGRALAGGFVEDGAAVGHRLRERGAPRAAPRAATEQRRASIVIVGGGMAGLSCAWWLARHGMTDFVVLELQSAAGGNSRAGEASGTRFPWGAHYVPVPGPRAEWVRLLFEEMGVFAGGTWRETDLCAAPKERTFAYGRWREGLVEAVAAGARDHEELQRFADRLVALRATGEFTIPLALGAREDSPLDRLTMDAWLRQEGFTGGALRWLADYSCRDDFGTSARETSAWAALHYFAARDTDEEGPLTWPEGNGRIVAHLMSKVGDRVVPSAPVHRVESTGTAATAPLRVLAGDTAWTCDAVVWAAPTFVGAHVVEGAQGVPWDHAPWMVANVVLDRMPREAPADFPRAWDNVIADSRSLGYVVATHQALEATPAEGSVWTHYWALCDEPPGQARRRLLGASWRSCAEQVLADLERAHPDIRECVARVDVRRYGHAMPRPVPGFLARHAAWGRERAPGAAPSRVLWASSDVSGLSLFEEAQYRGIVAAQRTMGIVGGGARDSVRSTAHRMAQPRM